MVWTAFIRHLAVILALAGTTLLPSWAQEKVSIRGASVNMRAGPSTDSAVLFQLAQGFPLEVTGRRGQWLKVKDFEGDEGWVARSVTGREPHHIVKAERVNLRSGPGTRYRVVGQVHYGDVLRTVRRQAGWVQVQNPNGQGTVWVAATHVWGW